MPLDVGLWLAHGFDPVSFAVDRLRWRPDNWQATLLRCQSRYICINASRQSGKSTTTAALALHTALYEPGSLILLVSPSLRQSRELFLKVTTFLRDLEPRLSRGGGQPPELHPGQSEPDCLTAGRWADDSRLQRTAPNPRG
jgi:hypothetical protein